MSLLSDLWKGTSVGGGGCDGGGGRDGRIGGSALTKPQSSVEVARESNYKRQDMSYVQAVGSSSSGERRSTKLLDSKSPNGASTGWQNASSMLLGSKRPHSPKEMACWWCFRPTHKTMECRHQVVCLRCACVSHVAA